MRSSVYCSYVSGWDLHLTTLPLEDEAKASTRCAHLSPRDPDRDQGDGVGRIILRNYGNIRLQHRYRAVVRGRN